MKTLRSPWVLAVLAIVFGLGTQAGVFALKLGLLGQHEPEPPPPPTMAPETLSWSFVTPAIEGLRTELMHRIEVVAAREKDLEDYENRLKAERAEIEKLKGDVDAMRKTLEARRAEIMATVTEIQTGEQKNLKTLATTYSNLSPAAALAIFKEMDDEAVVKILAFMKPDPVGQILEEMARTKEGEGTLAGRAAAISNKLRLLRQVKAEETS